MFWSDDPLYQRAFSVLGHCARLANDFSDITCRHWLRCVPGSLSRHKETIDLETSTRYDLNSMAKVRMWLLLRWKIDVERVMELDSAELHLEISTQSNVLTIVKSHYICEWNGSTNSYLSDRCQRTWTQIVQHKGAGEIAIICQCLLYYFSISPWVSVGLFIFSPLQFPLNKIDFVFTTQLNIGGKAWKEHNLSLFLILVPYEFISKSCNNSLFSYTLALLELKYKFAQGLFNVVYSSTSSFY